MTAGAQTVPLQSSGHWLRPAGLGIALWVLFCSALSLLHPHSFLLFYFTMHWKDITYFSILQGLTVKRPPWVF